MIVELIVIRTRFNSELATGWTLVLADRRGREYAIPSKVEVPVGTKATLSIPEGHDA